MIQAARIGTFQYLVLQEKVAFSLYLRILFDMGCLLLVIVHCKSGKYHATAVRDVCLLRYFDFQSKTL